MQVLVVGSIYQGAIVVHRFVPQPHELPACLMLLAPHWTWHPSKDTVSQWHKIAVTSLPE